MIDLSFVPEAPMEGEEPSKLLIFSLPKTGKTTITAQLPNSLLIDLENGSGFVSGVKQNIRKESAKRGVHPIIYLNELASAIKKKNAELGKAAYDFIIIDPLTTLENLAMELAATDYRTSVMGKSWTGKNIVKDLSNGAGYEWLRDAFERLYKMFDGLAGKSLILLGHVKLTSISKKGADLSAKDLNLVGKSKLLVTSDMDCTGYMFRDVETGNNILSFRTEEQDLITGSRIKKLADKEIIISSTDEKGNVITHWEEIFPSIKK